MVLFCQCWRWDIGKRIALKLQALRPKRLLSGDLSALRPLSLSRPPAPLPGPAGRRLRPAGRAVRAGEQRQGQDPGVGPHPLRRRQAGLRRRLGRHGELLSSFFGLAACRAVAWASSAWASVLGPCPGLCLAYSQSMLACPAGFACHSLLPPYSLPPSSPQPLPSSCTCASQRTPGCI